MQRRVSALTRCCDDLQFVSTNTRHLLSMQCSVRWSVKFLVVHTQAGKVARLFARFDLNDDGRLDLFELTKLACGFDLSSSCS